MNGYTEITVKYPPRKIETCSQCKKQTVSTSMRYIMPNEKVCRTCWSAKK